MSPGLSRRAPPPNSAFPAGGPVWVTAGLIAVLTALFFLHGSAPAAEPLIPNGRRPGNDEDLRYWLENMAWHHGFSLEEMAEATALTPAAVAQALTRLQINRDGRPGRAPGGPLLVLPYPGGRHPRIGFLDGAIRPQRETKISVFTPWDEASYVVVDVPEAIWSNLGLTYLAHTHVPTVFDKQAIKLTPLEWNRRPDGTLDSQRILPNGIGFGSRIAPATNGVRMEMWLRNGTSEPLRDLRVQVCVMLKGAAGFTAQTNANKVLAKPFVACRSEDGTRWILTAWEPSHRVWANPPVPCLHADPKFPDCAPGETQRLRGWLSFYQGTNIQAEFDRLEKLDWRR